MGERCRRERCPNVGRFVIELTETGEVVRACEVHTWPHFRTAPLTPEGYCCCTCNPYDEKVPGAGLARQPSLESIQRELAEIGGGS